MAKQTCKQDPELVRRNRNDGGLCGAGLCSLHLQLQMHLWHIDFLQLTGAQNIVHPPGHRVQSAHWNTQHAASDWPLHIAARKVCIFMVLIFIVNTYISDSSPEVCPAMRCACLHRICTGLWCALRTRQWRHTALIPMWGSHWSQHPSMLGAVGCHTV